MGNEIFQPNCKRGEDGVLTCTPVRVMGGRMITTQSPVKLILNSATGKAEIVDTGGADEVTLEKLIQHIERNQI
jgi:hypothetical protein